MQVIQIPYICLHGLHRLDIVFIHVCLYCLRHAADDQIKVKQRNHFIMHIVIYRRLTMETLFQMVENGLRQIYGTREFAEIHGVHFKDAHIADGSALDIAEFDAEQGTGEDIPERTLIHKEFDLCNDLFIFQNLIQENDGFTGNDRRIGGGACKNGGGCIQIEAGGTCVIEGGTIYQCTTNDHGGAVKLSGASDKTTTLLMTGGAVNNCQTVYARANTHGGAIYSDYGTVYLDGVELDSCFAEDNGGAVYMNSGNLYIKNSVFSGNRAGGKGGAIGACVLSAVKKKKQTAE